MEAMARLRQVWLPVETYRRQADAAVAVMLYPHPGRRSGCSLYDAGVALPNAMP